MIPDNLLKALDNLPEDYRACVYRAYGMDPGQSGMITRRSMGTILNTKENKPMEYREAKSRLDELLKITDKEFDAMKLEEMRSYNEELSSLDEFIKAEDVKIQERKKLTQKVANGAGTVIRSWNNNNNVGGNNNVEELNKDLNIRSFQKYVTDGIKSMNETEQRALDLSGSAAVLPTAISEKLITSEKYSDLLNRATVINQGGAGSIYIPIASNNAAEWKVENAPATEAAPTLTKLELKGFELMRLLTISAATSAMAVGNFMDSMLNLLSSEVVETLEASFINGTGLAQPKGLSELTYTTGTDQVLTASAATAISPANIAQAIGLLPQKYSRQAVIVCNADTLYNLISLFQGTAEYAFSMAEGASKFMGKPIIVSEHVADDELYVVDPSQLYVRFAAPIAMEADRSSGFTSASISLRALTVVDSVWNQKAVVRVGLGS